MKAAFLTLGCKVNSYETEAMRLLMEENGYDTVPFSSDADIYVVNSCSVTNMADRKSRQMLHRARKMNPDAVIVVTGCFAQANHEDIIKKAEADIVLGNAEKSKIVEAVTNYLSKNSEEKYQNNALCDMNGKLEYEKLYAVGDRENTRAYVKIQDGCNQFCSYCIIPYMRGRIRSRDEESILDEINKLAGKGFKEVVLTGIHLSSYGMERENAPKQLGDNPYLIPLIRKIAAVPGIERIRLGSLEPRIITHAFVKELAEIQEVCPHFHLSLQSGSDSTLRAMNRKYTAEEYYEALGILRKYYDRPALTTDMIVGFAGETEDNFSESLAFAEKCGFFMIHVFKFSVRKGTRAASMSGQVREEIKTERSNILINAAQKLQREYVNSFMGEETNVLFEEIVSDNGKSYFCGHNERYLRILLPEEEKDELKYCSVKPDGKGGLKDIAKIHSDEDTCAEASGNAVCGELFRVRIVGITDNCDVICTAKKTN